jgi:hypothetical protein
MSRKFRLFAGFAVGGMLLSAGLGSAAGLGVLGGTLQEGVDSELTCTTNVSLTWLNTVGDASAVEEVAINADASCDGDTAYVSTEDGSDCSDVLDSNGDGQCVLDVAADTLDTTSATVQIIG